MAEAFGIDSENYLFHMLSQSGNGIPNLIIDPKPIEVCKISAFTVLQYIDKINDKPIGEIKYALT